MTFDGVLDVYSAVSLEELDRRCAVRVDFHDGLVQSLQKL